MSTKCTCYCHQGGELYHGDRPCCGRPYELFAEQEPARHVLVPVEVRDFYEFAAMVFEPFTPQQEQLKVSLKKAQAAMWSAAAPEPPQERSLDSEVTRKWESGELGRSEEHVGVCAADAPRSGDAPVAYQRRRLGYDGMSWEACDKDFKANECWEVRALYAEPRARATVTEAPPVAWQWRPLPYEWEADGKWRTAKKADYDHAVRTGRFPGQSRDCEVRALYTAPPADARDGEIVRESAAIVREILGPGGGLRANENLPDMLHTLQCVFRSYAEDARRYRWLRGGHEALCATKLDGELNQIMVVGEELDRKIDSAMGAGGGK